MQVTSKRLRRVIAGIGMERHIALAEAAGLALDAVSP